MSTNGADSRGKRIVLTAPLTETIDHAGYFIQMALASLPKQLEGIINQKYPNWRNLPPNSDGSAKFMPAGIRVVEASLAREFSADDMVACYPQDVDKFIGPDTRVVAISTHNPLGVTFAAGVYASIFGSSKEPINAAYSRELFERVKNNPHRSKFKVIVGGSGGWQIAETNHYEQLSVDCVIQGRSESEETMEIFRKAIRGEDLPKFLEVGHPKGRDGILTPAKRTTFGVIEMTTGCGRRCQFCLPDLNPQIDVPKDKIMEAVHGNVAEGNEMISLATEDMFIWGQVHTSTPFYFPNREALLDLYGSIVNTPGVRHHVLSHSTIAPAVVDPLLIEKLSNMLLDKSPVKLPSLSTHPEKRILSPLVGVETGSVRLAKTVMAGKGVPFPIDEWPSVVINGLTVMNRNNWFPVMTLIVGNPGETDQDCKDTLDLLYEVERRGLFAFFVPSIFTPLHDTRLAEKKGVEESREMTPLQWQVMMKCWKMNMRPALQSWWGPTAWRMGALFFWAYKLRKANGPNFTWPLFLFAGAMPEWLMAKMGKIYTGKPLKVKSRKELLQTIKQGHWKYLRADNGDLPEGYAQAAAAGSVELPQVLQ
ncbi:MAG: B12-binding domain-containing radical SAM protein [Bryobacterales bacterium]|nr:B12-binding domain-containing radical SAM protein [Bryobacterales bacterium]